MFARLGLGSWLYAIAAIAHRTKVTEKSLGICPPFGFGRYYTRNVFLMTLGTGKSGVSLDFKTNVASEMYVWRGFARNEIRCLGSLLRCAVFRVQFDHEH
jgi:hypothetical protein